jgi:uncharacterized membrane protein
MFRWIVLVFAFLFPTSAMASTYDVSGVEWGDVLNIRKSPTAKSAIVGAIPYDGRDVETSGSASKGWIKVDYRGVKGFVLAKYLGPRQADGPLPTTLTCHGTEPFWNAEFSAKGATYQFMTDPKVKLDIGAFEQTANRSDSWMAMGPKSAASVTRGAKCSNGMSDDLFPYSIHMSTPASGIVSGCCK